MKLIIAIVSDKDYEKITRGLTSEEYRVTCIASTGGFFRRGNTTLLIGLEKERMNRALEIIKENSTSPDVSGTKKTTIFVLDIKQFVHL
jgi:uncharacterized protein YaaQ